MSSMMDMDAAAFEALVVDELDRLPDDMVDGLDNVVFVVEDRPEDGSLDLLGLYDGWALTERDRYGVGELPDRIIVYREPHLAACETEDELRDEVHTTLVHEIAHFYGIDDDRLHELGMGMMAMLATPDVDEQVGIRRRGARPDRPWQTVVWNDPVNLMSYVTHVFREYFGFDRAACRAADARRAPRRPRRGGRGCARADGAARAGHARLRPVGDRPAGAAMSARADASCSSSPGWRPPTSPDW